MGTTSHRRYSRIPPNAQTAQYLERKLEGGTLTVRPVARQTQRAHLVWSYSGWLRTPFRSTHYLRNPVKPTLNPFRTKKPCKYPTKSLWFSPWLHLMVQDSRISRPQQRSCLVRSSRLFHCRRSEDGVTVPPTEAISAFLVWLETSRTHIKQGYIYIYMYIYIYIYI